MSLFRIAWRSIQQRGLASVLTMLSMALGVMMVVAVLSVHGVVAQSFRNNSSLGYNLIVGAKGGKLQLTLNTVYYLSQPVENIPYEYFLEFQPASVRREALSDSLREKAIEARMQDLRTLALTGDGGSGGLGALGLIAAESGLQNVQRQSLGADRDGKFALFTEFAIPLCLGDYFGRFRVVGTTPEMFELLAFGPAGERHFEFAQGRNFQTWSDEHGYFEAVVGATVASEMGVRIGDPIAPSHGDPDGEQHGTQFTVVGVLKPSGTPNDRAVFINMEGFYLMDDHAKPVAEDETSGSDVATVAPADIDETRLRQEQLPVEQREVTSILVRTSSDLYAMGIETSINEGRDAQAVPPVREITILFDQFVSPVQLALLVVTGLICVVSGISILVSIYNSMSDRKHEIAVMRALGANRGTVMTIILLESVLLSLAGGLAGWVGGHALNVLASGQIEARTGVAIGFFSLAPPIENLELLGFGQIMGWMSPEIWLIPGLILLAIVVGFLPAVSAYRTDVAESLGS